MRISRNIYRVGLLGDYRGRVDLDEYQNATLEAVDGWMEANKLEIMAIAPLFIGGSGLSANESKYVLSHVVVTKAKK